MILEPRGETGFAHLAGRERQHRLGGVRRQRLLGELPESVAIARHAATRRLHLRLELRIVRRRHISFGVSVRKSLSPFSTFRRAATSFGRRTPVELPVWLLPARSWLRCY
jgi:hypothetical protein